MHRRSVRSLLVWCKAVGVKSFSGAAILVCVYLMSITVPM